jgi:hypothetical protein
MKRILLCSTFLLVSTASLFAQKAEQCPLTVADIESVFGKGFKAEETSKLGEILSCRFSNKDYTIQISIQPGYGMKIDDYNKMMSPKTVTWKPVPNDADAVRIEIRDEKKDDLARTPAVTYIRKDKYVRLQILGNYYNYDNSKLPKLLDEMREKLVKVKRVP